jgi:enoyl reductase
VPRVAPSRSASVLAATLAVLLVHSAAAAKPPGNRETSGGQDGENIHAGAEKISWDDSRNGSGDGSGPVTTTSRTWTPPPCWYAPTWTPSQFEAYFEDVWAL